MPRDRDNELSALRTLLAARQQTTALELAEELNVSRPTISRLLARLGNEVVRIGAARQARYSLRRDVRRLGGSWPVFRTDERGDVRHIATLEALHGGYRLDPVPPIVQRDSDYAEGVFAGFPFIFADVQPQGFLGRVQAKQVAASLGVPTDAREWSSEDLLTYLLGCGDDLPGNVVFGDAMAERVRNARAGVVTDSPESAIGVKDRAARYPLLAERIIRGESFGSSAGGEQPKFATWVMDEGDVPRAVIVKFSPETKTAAGQRWADLLLAEFHALNVLRRNGIVAPPVQFFDSQFRRFLEVTRYDRVGARGRRGLISLRSVVDGFVDGDVKDWIDGADQLEAAGLLPEADARVLRRLHCFGEMIGNSDMHLGNVTFWWRDEAPLSLAPVYDMLPMFLAPSSQGELVQRNPPELHRNRVSREDWAIAERWALEFWRAVAADAAFTQEFREQADAAQARILAQEGNQARPEPATPGEAFQKFAEEFPHVAQALTEQKKKSDPRLRPDPESRAALRRELGRVNATSTDLTPVIESLFPEGLAPDNLAEFGLGGYIHLGTGDIVRAFSGRLWADVLAHWSVTSRRAFLDHIIEDGRNIFEALDFIPETFRRHAFDAEVMLPWLKRARQRLGNDLYQQGYWRAVESFATRSPQEAVEVISRWLQTGPTELDRGVIANLLSHVRLLTHKGGPLSARIQELDARLRAKGFASDRVLYLHSWAVAGGAAALTEGQALQLRDELAGFGPEERAAWCRLLCAVTLADPLSWEWTYRELSAASSAQSPEGKYWLLVAATTGWERAEPGSTVTREQWESLILATLPYDKEHQGLWNRLESFLGDAVERTPERLRDLLRTVAIRAGDDWVASLEARDSHAFMTTVRSRGIHPELATDLLFDDVTVVRRLGLALFAQTFVERLEPLRLERADARRLEIIFRETQWRVYDGAVLGRLHASLAAHLDKLAPEVQAQFFAEVKLQARSTAAYRETLAAGAAGIATIAEAIKEVEESWAKLRAAAESPALQMKVPGHARALANFHRRFARDLARSTDQHSVFLKLTKKVQLMYGSKWRMMQEKGLSPATSMNAYSASFEVPQMEFIDPEGLNWKRIKARQRLEELEAQK